MHSFQSSRVVCDFGGERAILDEHERAVQLLLADQLHHLSILLLYLHALDGPRGALSTDLGVAVALLALNDKVVLDKVGEDVTVHAVRCACIEGLLCEARSGIDGRGGHEVHVGSYDDVVGGVEGWILLIADVGGECVDGDAWVELADLGRSCFGAVLAHVGVGEEELGAQVIFGDGLVVSDGDGADACENQVLCDLVGEGFEADEEDVGGAYLLLGLDAPEADLTVVEGDFVCTRISRGTPWRPIAPRIPAEILVASAMAATVWPAASSAGTAGRVPLAAGGGSAEGSVTSAMSAIFFWVAMALLSTQFQRYKVASQERRGTTARQRGGGSG